MEGKEFIDAQEYFTKLKNSKKKITVVDLNTIYDSCLVLLNKYSITGQTEAMKKLIFHMACLDKEKEIYAAGVDTFIYLADLKEYISKVSDRSVKVIELENYEREIPNEVVEVLQKVKSLFTNFIVVFTDYTKEKEHQKKYVKRIDPILFGMFKDYSTSTIVERLYFIADWEDELCDLTLDKLVADYKNIKNKDIKNIIKYPKTLEELKEQLNSMSKTSTSIGDTGLYVSVNDAEINNTPVYTKKTEEKKSFFRNIKFFSKK